MAAKDLITLQRAKDGNPNYTGGSDTLVAELITAASDAIQKYCRRRFISTGWDELYNGSGDRRLYVRQYPIQSVASVRYRPVTVLKITNTLPANVQARVSVLNTGLQLVRVNAGVKTTTTTGLTFAGNVTLTALAAAVNAAEGGTNGWSAQVVGDATNYGSWPSADLYCPASYGDPLEQTGIQTSQGALQCVAGSFAELKMHTYELQGYQWDARGWLLRAIPYTDPELLHPEDLIWPVGINNFRIQYTAGYTTIPEAVQEACAEWVWLLYYQAQRDPGLGTQAGGGVAQGWTLNTRGTILIPPDPIAILLAPYKRHTIANNQG